MKPWERQKNETSKAFEAFILYRDMGVSRTQEKVSKELAKSRDIIWRWCSTYDWVERAAAYDGYIDSMDLQEREKEHRAMLKRHVQLSLAFQNKIAEGLRKINPDRLTPKDLVIWLDVATKLERSSRGDHEERKVKVVEDKLAIEEKRAAGTGNVDTIAALSEAIKKSREIYSGSETS